jgi:D-alanine-D-alanine ligase
MTSTETPKRIFVLMGGMSSEHDVSLNSGRKVVAALAGTAYRVTPVVIGRDGLWQFGEAAPVSIYEAVAYLREATCVFLALHGEFGEDGRIQGFLDVLGLPYTSSGCAASALAMDKVRAKAVVQAQGIPVAGHVALSRPAWAVDDGQVIEAVTHGLGFPCVVKPSALGSSVAMAIPKNVEELRQAVDAAFDVTEDLMIEQFIQGVEVTCAVLEADPGGFIRPLPLTEICPREGAFFDYHCKYTPGATEEITPARLDDEMTDRIQEMSAHVHQILGLSIWSRSDFIVTDEGPFWLEVNTIPGLTETSLFPQAAKAAGIEYPALIALFIEAALQRHAQEKGAR